MTLRIYNTLTRRKEVFRPLRKDRVGLYTCGPTVYNYAHIGNLRTYIFEDVLRRALEYSGYKVKHVMNITDVGHLTSDADLGDDKLDREARKEGKSVWEIAKFYTDRFWDDIKRLNIKKADHILPATKAIKEQVKIIRQLFKRGCAYETAQAVYFDVSKFKNYTKLSRQKLSQKIVGAREEIVADPDKKNPYDFALWFKLAGRFKNHIMRWSSPWGQGFPGWHIECSAISTKFLGQPFDIHTGGVDHIGVHHTNEIAQSEAAFGKPLAKYWMHGEFLLIDAGKMAKSEGNFITLGTLLKKEFNPLSYRYLVLSAHYRSKLNFTWKSLVAAENSLKNLYDFIRKLKEEAGSKFGIKKAGAISKYKKSFEEALFDDLGAPGALAAVWDMIRAYNKQPANFNPRSVLSLLYNFDSILGLGLKDLKSEKPSRKVLALVKKREIYRINKQWQKADEIRAKVWALGYFIEDSSHGPIAKKQ
ncbi:MAG: cysteine--tRNA ligase [Candidatus Sungbacteria bacterium]|nr:cysteine--tRNA ligase [Candidatus Sungbacteria bacterium]